MDNIDNLECDYWFFIHCVNFTYAVIWFSIIELVVILASLGFHETFVVFQKLIQNPVKHLRGSFFAKIISGF